MTPEQRRAHNQQNRNAELRRFANNPLREVVKHARNAANSARRRGAKRGAHEFTITEDDLDCPTRCPVFPWIELHYPGHFRHDPAGMSLERLDVKKGYVPGNVIVVSLRANVLRKNATAKELQALADFYFLMID